MTGSSVLDGREEVLQAIADLLSELEEGVRWENDTLEAFIESFGALLGSIENAYANTGQPIPNSPWPLVARAIRGAREYE